MGKIQSVGKGQNTAGKYTKRQEDLIYMGTFLPEYYREQKYPDGCHILKHNGRTGCGEFDGNDIQDTGDTHHQGGKYVCSGKPQAKASFYDKKH